MYKEEMYSTFYNSGFFIVKQLFNQNEVEKISQGFDCILNESKKLTTTGIHKKSLFVLGEGHSSNSPKIKRVNWCATQSNAIDKYSKDKRILEIAEKLMGVNEVSQIICQAHYKLPNDGVSYPWHQDTQKDKGEWQDLNGKGSFVLSMIAIDECNKENGTVKVIPGSCKKGPLDIEKEDFSKNNLIINSEYSDLSFSYLNMSPGDVAFMGPYTIHSSDANTSLKARRMLMSGFSCVGSKKGSMNLGDGRIVSSR